MGNKYFIDPFSNDQFSILRGLTLQDLIVQIENFYLSYRDSLNLNKDTSFGYEIEFEGCSQISVVNHLNNNNYDGWKCKHDSSLHGPSGEVVSPILHDKKEDWEQLKRVCEFLEKKGAITNDDTGGHIHVGVQSLGNDIDAWLNLFLIYTSYEHVIFRFFYADKIGPRTGIEKYAKPIGDFLYSVIKKMNKDTTKRDLYTLLDNDRYSAMNFRNIVFWDDFDKEEERNTIEFRGFNGSTNEGVLQNNVLFLGNLLDTAKIGNYDKEFVKYKLEKERISSDNNFIMYNEVNIKDALEFADLVFNNNLDKVYFLRQYFKGFQNAYGVTSAINSKKFVK